MAVNISNTKYFKKGEKLPDGTTAKRGIVWNTKTGKRVTGTVQMAPASAGAGTAGSTKSYKGGRSVAALQRTAAKKAAAKKTAAGDRSAPAGSTPPKPPAKNPAKPPAVGTVRRGAAGRQMNRWNGTKWVPVTGTTGSARSGETARARNAAAASTTAKPRPKNPTSNTGGLTPQQLAAWSARQPTMSSAKPPKKGDKRTIINSQNQAETQIYDGSTWRYWSSSTKSVTK